MAAKNVEWYNFQGKASWAKLITPDIEFKNWNVKLHLTPESYNQFMKLREDDGNIGGILNEVKKDEDGYFVILRRPMEKWGTLLPPPVITDKDGNPWRGESIGNGSDITVKVECYKYKKPFNKGQGRAIRLVAVRVDNLVVYEKKDMTGQQLHAVAGLDAAPKQLF